METKFISKDGRKRRGVFVECAECKKTFATRVDQPAKYCCRDCSYKARQVRDQCKCAGCGKNFTRRPSKKKSKSGLFFCTRKCKDKSQRIGGIREIMPPHYGTAKPENSYRKLFEEHELYCRRCGYNEFPCSVDIHHKDRNRGNGKKKNLLPLCKCCHQGLHAGLWQLSEL